VEGGVMDDRSIVIEKGQVWFETLTRMGSLKGERVQSKECWVLLKMLQCAAKGRMFKWGSLFTECPKGKASSGEIRLEQGRLKERILPKTARVDHSFEAMGLRNFSSRPVLPEGIFLIPKFTP
jgi:hypothetical protein